MAYLRKDTKTLEIEYPLDAVWNATKKAISTLDMDTVQTDDDAHHVKAKTKSGLLRLSAAIMIDAEAVDTKKTKIVITAEKPVTTITAMLDFEQASQLINIFIAQLAKQLKE